MQAGVLKLDWWFVVCSVVAKMIRTYEIEGIAILEIHGRLTSRSSCLEALRDTAYKLTQSGSKLLAVDLGEVTKLDDTGIGELVAACTMFSKGGGSVVVANISKAVEKRLARMLVFPFPTMGSGPFNSVEDAIRALRTLEAR